MWRCLRIGLVLGCAIAAAPEGLLAAGQARYFLLVVWDGMRPDFVTPELTPALYALRDEGVWFANHHSAYPSSTEVNGTVLATGVLPQRNGVTANKEYRAGIDPLKQFGTQSLSAVRRGDAITGGRYVALPTVAELVQAHGLRTAVVGAKPVALLQDRLERGEDALGWVWFVDGTLPASKFALLTNQFGPFPAPVSPNLERDTWAVRCLTEAFWDDQVSRFSVLWLSEPDFSQHEHGPGSLEALAAIRSCDQRLAAVLAELSRRGVRAQTDIVVLSDHGFSTIGTNADVAAALRAQGINAQNQWTQPPTENDVVVVGNGGSVLLYVIGSKPEQIGKVVRCLQHQPFAGVIFTRDGLPGTFPLAEAMIAAPTAADVVVASRWTPTNQTNAHPVSLVFNDGYNEYDPGCGMHVTLCPTDLHNLAVASGPDFRPGVSDPLPTGNVDVAPTLLWLMGIAPPKTLDGRVLREALVNGGTPLSSANPGRRDARCVVANGVWEQYLKFTELNGVRYLDEGNGRWVAAAVPQDHGTNGLTRSDQ